MQRHFEIELENLQMRILEMAAWFSGQSIESVEALHGRNGTVALDVASEAATEVIDIIETPRERASPRDRSESPRPAGASAGSCRGSEDL